MPSFVKIKSSRNGEITLWFTDICISCHSREILTSQICLLTLIAKIKFSRKFLNLQCIVISMFYNRNENAEDLRVSQFYRRFIFIFKFLS